MAPRNIFAWKNNGKQRRSKPELAGKSFPTPPQGAVKRDGIQQPRGLELHKILLRRVKVTLREEHIDVAVDALTVAGGGKVEAFLFGIQKNFLGFDFFVQDRANGQCVGDFSECDLNGFFVIGYFDFFADF